MRKEEIELLARKSFLKRTLDPKKVNNFIKGMKRRDLRTYIALVKKIDAENKIKIEVADIESLGKDLLDKIAKAYPGKKVEVRENKELLLGVRVTNDDLIYEFNFNNNLDEILANI